MAIVAANVPMCNNSSRWFSAVLLHAALLMAALSTPLLCVREQFYEFFIQKIFPMASDDEIAFDLDRRVLCEQAHLLHRMMLIL